MIDLWQRLQQRRMVQWAVAYTAASFALLQGVDIVADRFAWPGMITRVLIIASFVGFFITLVLAWYHGERGEQKVKGTEVVLLVLLLAMGGGLIWEFSARPTGASPAIETSIASQQPVGTEKPAPVIPAKSIAVLPFENLSADKNNEFFAIGMQDMILTKLADIRDLKVISRTSTQEYGSRPANLKLIARQLGVATVLEGSVQRDGNEVLINVQLIDAQTDAHLWADNYQRTLDNIFEVEAEVAEKVAEALNASLTDSEANSVASAATKDPKAYELYLKSSYEAEQYFNGGGDPAHILLAESYLRQAIVKDPDFALAYAVLAGRMAVTWANGIKDSPERRDEAMGYAKKALALQPDLAEGHVAMGIMLQFLENDRPQSIKELRTAQSLAPNDARPPAVLSVLLAGAGRWEEAQALNADAMKLDPRSLSIHEWGVNIALSLGDYERAQALIDTIMLEFPDQPTGQILAAELFILLGDPDAALELLANVPEAQQGDLVTSALFYSRNYNSMREAAERAPAAALDADAGQRKLDKGIAVKLSGDDAAAKVALEAAANAIQQAMVVLPNELELAGRLVAVRMWQGDRDGAMQALTQEREIARKDWNSAFGELATGIQEAKILAHFNDAEAAVTKLRQLLTTSGISALLSPALLRLDPTWDPIRETPQFQALLIDYPAAIVAGERA